MKSTPCQPRKGPGKWDRRRRPLPPYSMAIFPTTPRVSHLVRKPQLFHILSASGLESQHGASKEEEQRTWPWEGIQLWAGGQTLPAPIFLGMGRGEGAPESA